MHTAHHITLQALQQPLRLPPTSAAAAAARVLSVRHHLLLLVVVIVVVLLVIVVLLGLCGSGALLPELQCCCCIDTLQQCWLLQDVTHTLQLGSRSIVTTGNDTDRQGG